MKVLTAAEMREVDRLKAEFIARITHAVMHPPQALRTRTEERIVGAMAQSRPAGGSR